MTRPLLPIRAVAMKTGLTADSIRAWEKRYQAVKPKRAKGGRLFSEEDVNRLILLKQAVDLGHSIGQVARLNNRDLKQVVHGGDSSVEKQTIDETSIDPYLKTIMEGLADYDAVRADRILGKLAALLAPRQFAFEVMVPLMKRVGDAWQRGEIDEAQEHLVSQVLRGVTTTLLRQNLRFHQPTEKLIFSTPEAEHHEFGILVASILTLAAGYGVIFLGPNLPPKAIAKAAQKTGAKAVVLGLGPGQDLRDDTLFQINQLRRQLNADCQIILGGGPNTDEFAELLAKRGIHYAKDFEVFELLLNNEVIAGKHFP